MASKLRDRAFSLGAPKRENVTVTIDGEALTFEVRALSIARRGELMTRCTVPDDDGEGQHVDFGRIAPDLVIESTFDPETGEAVFGAADRDAVGELGPDLIDPIIGVATRLSGFSSESKQAAEKNSAPTPVSASGSPSPES